SMPITQMERKSRSEYVVVRQLNKLGVRCRSSRLRNCGAGLSPVSPSSAGNWLNDDKKAMKYRAATPRQITARAMVQSEGYNSGSKRFQSILLTSGRGSQPRTDTLQ